MKLILPWSLPAIAGIASWILSWALAFAFARNGFHPYAYDIYMTCNRIFSFMDLIGPVAAIFAIIAVYKSACTFPTRVVFYVLNVAWGIFSLFLSVQFWFWYAHRR